MRIPRFAPSRTVLVVALLMAAALTTAAWLGLRPQSPPAEPDFPSAEATPAPATAPAGPPWRYGRADARFTVVEYADLECPFCRAYFAVLKRWIDAHPDVSWQWHHLPLPLHEPAASAGARLVECVGEAGGQAAFWQAAEWVYTHTRGDGQGLPEGLRYPDLTPAAQQCLDSDRPDALIRAQSASAAQEGIKVIFVLLQNYGFASIGALSESRGSQRFGTKYRGDRGEILPVDIAANAESWGLKVLRVSTIDDFKQAYAEAKGLDVPVMIHIETDLMGPNPPGSSWWPRR